MNRRGLGEDLLCGALFTEWSFLLLYFLQGWVGYDLASRQRVERGAWGEFHHVDGGPGLLFLMVASEHSASDESPSESPNCKGF